ncbi:MAG: C40 family peptidase [Lysobacterales bacterium]
MIGTSDGRHRSASFALLVLIVLLAGCASGPSSRPPAAHDHARPTPLATGNSADVAFRAIGLVGTPYRTAGADPGVGFDCSGFVQYVYRDAAGLQLPRNTQNQHALKIPVSRRSLRTGDLVFFNTSGRGVSHVGIYVGEGRFVHAPNHGGRVRLDHLDDGYWSKRYLGARRVLGG